MNPSAKMFYYVRDNFDKFRDMPLYLSIYCHLEIKDKGKNENENERKRIFCVKVKTTG